MASFIIPFQYHLGSYSGAATLSTFSIPTLSPLTPYYSLAQQVKAESLQLIIAPTPLAAAQPGSVVVLWTPVDSIPTAKNISSIFGADTITFGGTGNSLSSLIVPCSFDMISPILKDPTARTDGPRCSYLTTKIEGASGVLAEFYLRGKFICTGSSLPVTPNA